jgi:hypothetical protein
MAILLIAMGSKRVAQEIEALFAGVFQRGLRLVDCQPEPHHHRSLSEIILLTCLRLQRFGLAADQLEDIMASFSDVAQYSPTSRKASLLVFFRSPLQITRQRRAALAGHGQETGSGCTISPFA